MIKRSWSCLHWASSVPDVLHKTTKAYGRYPRISRHFPSQAWHTHANMCNRPLGDTSRPAKPPTETPWSCDLPRPLLAGRWVGWVSAEQTQSVQWPWRNDFSLKQKSHVGKPSQDLINKRSLSLSLSVSIALSRRLTNCLLQFFRDAFVTSRAWHSFRSSWRGSSRHSASTVSPEI